MKIKLLLLLSVSLGLIYYFLLYPVIYKHMFFNQFDFIQKQVLFIDAKRDATCWTTVRQIETYYSNTDIDEVLVQLNLEIIKDIVRRIWARASDDSSLLPMLTKRDIERAVPETLTGRLKDSFLVQDLSSKNFYDQYGKLSENWRVLSSVLDDYIVFRWDSTIQAYPKLKPLSENAMNYLADIIVSISAFVLREAHNLTHEGYISEEVLKAVFKDVVTDFDDNFSYISWDKHDYYFESQEEALSFLKKKNKAIIQGKVDALSQYNDVLSVETTYQNLFNKLVDIPLTEEASQHIVKHLNNLTRYVALGISSMFSSFNFAASPEHVFEKSSPYLLGDFEFYGDTEDYLSLNWVYDNLSHLFPVKLLSNGDVLLRRLNNVYQEISTAKINDAHDKTIKLLSYESDAVRDSGIHWKILGDIWKEDDVRSMDLFALELLAERISILATFLLQESEKRALSFKKDTIDVTDVNAIFNVKDMWMPLPFKHRFFSWFTEKNKNQFLSLHDSPYFIDISKQSGVKQTSYMSASDTYSIFESIGSGIGVGDVNDDGFVDIFLTGEGGNTLYINNGDQTFSDKTDFYNITDRNYDDSRQALFVDINNDGRLDLFIVHAYSKSQLFLQTDQGDFKNITDFSGIRTDYHAQTAVFFDMDNDGLLDLFVGHFGPNMKDHWEVRDIKKKMTLSPDLEKRLLEKFNKDAFYVAIDGKNGQKSQLYKNLGGGRFEDISNRSGIDSTGFVLAASAIDYDNDGDEDLYVVNDFGFDNLYINQGDNTFEEKASVFGLDDRGNGMNISFTDINEDGFWDSFVTVIDMYSKNLTFHFPKSSQQYLFDDYILNSSSYSSGNKLFLNQEGRRSKSVESDYIEPAAYGWCWGAQFFDYENDGDQDLYITNGYYEGSLAGSQFNHFLLSDGNHLYRTQAKSAESFQGNSRGVVALDLTNSGKKDLLVTNLFLPLKVFKNTSLNENSWIKIKLKGIKNNRYGVGSKVTVYTSDNKQFSQYVSIGSQYLTQDDTTLTFGLGSNVGIIKIRVIWPGKKEQIIDGPIDHNRVFQIVENV